MRYWFQLAHDAKQGAKASTSQACFMAREESNFALIETVMVKEKGAQLQMESSYR